MPIDTHCHLTLRFDPGEIAQVLDRALRAGVRGVILVGYCPVHYRKTADILDGFGTGGGTLPALAGTIGIHPHEADSYTPSDIDKLRPELNRPDIVAIGETGLDFFRDYADRNRQEELFRAQARLAADTGFPLVIHSRNAFDRTVAILREVRLPERPGVFHCYGYGPDEVGTLIGMGFFVSFAGNLTYPSTSDLHQASKRVPGDRVLVETDSPFLVPQKAKNRKVKRNEPQFVTETFVRLAELRAWDPIEAESAMIANTLSCFPRLRDIESWSSLSTTQSREASI